MSNTIETPQIFSVGDKVITKSGLIGKVASIKNGVLKVALSIASISDFVSNKQTPVIVQERLLESDLHEKVELFFLSQELQAF